MNKARGFTLLEVVLALGLLALLSGVMVLATNSLQQEDELQAAAERVASVLRMARAEAALKARPVRVSVDESGGVRVEMETNPWQKPDEWWTVRASWAEQAEREKVSLKQEAKSPAVFRFEMDGSVEGGQWTLHKPDAESQVHWVIEVNGLTGEVSTGQSRSVEE